jgi:hypothetical protein
MKEGSIVKKLVSKTVLNISVICLLIWVFLSSVSGSEAQMNIFNIGQEKKISAPDMDCNYEYEDYWQAGYNFEYPKLIMANNGQPIIAFVDV